MSDQDQPNNQQTILRPQGGEVYAVIKDAAGASVTLTYNDLWILLVVRTTLDGDWVRAREAASMGVDPLRKRALVDRLWRLEQQAVLPIIPAEIEKLNLHRAHVWFNEREVSDNKSW